MLKTQAGQLGILLMLAAVFGGGGASHGLPNLVVQLAALTILALNSEAVRNFLVSAPRMLIALVVMTLTLPLVQLIPLPVSILSALPGRQLVSEAYAFADGPQWTAVTVNYARTFVAFVGLIAPFTVIAIGWSLNERDLLRLLSLIIGLGLLNLAPGFVEVLTNNSQSLLYPANEMSGVMFGLFANRNSTGLFLDCCLLLLVALPASKRPTLGTLTKLLIAVLLSFGMRETHGILPIWLLAFPLAPFLVDAGWTLLARILKREAWWTAHVTHVYQVWSRRLGAHLPVTLAYLVLALLGAGLAISIQGRDINFIKISLTLWYTVVSFGWWILRKQGFTRSF